MEENSLTLRPYTCKNPTSTPSKPAMHKDSHVISKFKPKVRIIHIFAPEVIKTDVAHFRELVQRLTGKGCESSGKKKGRSTLSSSISSKKQVMMKCSTDASNKKLGMQDGLLPCLIKEENEMWRAENSSIGLSELLDGFGDLNGFMHDLSGNYNTNFCLAAPQSSHHQYMNVLEDMRLN